MASSISPEVQAAWNNYLDEVRAASESRNVDYIRGVAQKWTAKGRDTFLCLSPLRQEKTPSFYVYLNKGCFDYGTQQGGDLLWFIQEFKKCTFREAVDEAAAFCGLQTWEQRKGTTAYAGASLTEEELLVLWNDEGKTRKVFECITALMVMANQAMPEYIRAHLIDHYGLENEYIDLNRIGWIPAGFWPLVHDWNIPFDDETLLATGFFHRAADGGTTPTMSERIVMGYWKNGVCKYVIGRQYIPPGPEPILQEWDRAKYKKLSTHDPEKRPYISKAIANDVLWGIDNVPRARNRTLVITEGVTDAMMLDQLGFPVISSPRTWDTSPVSALRAHDKFLLRERSSAN